MDGLIEVLDEKYAAVIDELQNQKQVIYDELLNANQVTDPTKILPVEERKYLAIKYATLEKAIQQVGGLDKQQKRDQLIDRANFLVIADQDVPGL